jgi:hypothetical protein
MRRLSLDTAYKVTSFTSYAPDDPSLFPDRWSSAGLVRSRFSLNAKYADWLNSEIAYEQRARLVSGEASTGAGGSILPSEAEAPYRMSQLDWQLADSGTTFAYRHEFDRALVSLHPAWGEITIGRQAIGLGRGVLFGAVDIFSPFSPLEVDREWRRGVDAVRAEWNVTDTSSLELLAAFGESWDDSALLGRARGYIGSVDGELILGKRAQDSMFGSSLSAAVLGAEVHLELALFDTSEALPDGALFGDDHLVAKGVFGASYTFDVGNGVTLLVEYHYSGFGVKDIEEAMSRLEDPIFRERYLRGDTQILGQHAMALQLTYPFNETLSGALLVLQSPLDGSGLVVPSIGWDLTQNLSLTASGFFPWGNEPSEGRLGSEYGATPAALFVQLNLYY